MGQANSTEKKTDTHVEDINSIGEDGDMLVPVAQGGGHRKHRKTAKKQHKRHHRKSRRQH